MVATLEMVSNIIYLTRFNNVPADTKVETAFECMKVAYEAGINFFDTAEVYSGGQSEIVLGEAIKKFGWKQNDLVISTKVLIILVPISKQLIPNTLLDLLGPSQQRQP